LPFHPDEEFTLEQFEQNLSERYDKISTLKNLLIEFDLPLNDYQKGKLEGQKKILLELIEGVNQRRIKDAQE
jgi:hypothetical protein